MLNIIAALLVFGLIVLIHEFGHFLLAKLNGIGVVEFSIGMGPRICSFVKGETRYSLKILPLGGSCMMLGEDGEDQDQKAFNNKSVWARISVIAAGPVFNFILAFVFALILVGAVGFDEPRLFNVSEGTPAQESGLLAGDVITAINGRKIHFSREVSLHTSLNPGEKMDVEIQRVDSATGKTVKETVTVTPRYMEEYGTYMMGVGFEGYKKASSVFQIIEYGVYEVKYCVTSTIDGFRLLFTGKLKPQDALAGPVQIVTIIGGVVEESSSYGLAPVLLSLMNLSMILSVSLGFMNLLPIPALDGGRLVFLIIEAVRRKPIDREKEGMVHMAGMIFLMLLMVLVLFNDISKIF